MSSVLANRLGQSAELAFERLYREHVGEIFGFAYGVLGNRADAEDATQTTFLNAYRAFNRGDEIENVRAWLFTIAQNVCRQRFRTSARRPKEVELEEHLAEELPPGDAPSGAEIRAALGELAFNQRAVLVLREIEGLSYDEIAETLGITHSAVETLLFRGRRALREQLEAAEEPRSCQAVERLISLQLEGRLPRRDEGALRAHLRTCSECARLARRRRARKRVVSGLGWIPLPAKLAGLWESVGAGVGAKAATVAAGIAIATGGTLVATAVIPAPAGEPAETATSAPREPAGTAVEVSAAALAEANGSWRERPAGLGAAHVFERKRQRGLRLRPAERARERVEEAARGAPIVPTGGTGVPDVPSVGTGVPDVPSVGSVEAGAGVVPTVAPGIAEAPSKIVAPPASPLPEPPSLPLLPPGVDGALSVP